LISGIQFWRVAKAIIQNVGGKDNVISLAHCYTRLRFKLHDEKKTATEVFDTNRIYIGGDSNGGYMTMLMIRDYPSYFAAAFPTCEALRDDQRRQNAV